MSKLHFYDFADNFMKYNASLSDFAHVTCSGKLGDDGQSSGDELREKMEFNASLTWRKLNWMLS